MRIVIRKAAELLLVVFAISTLSFAILRLTGDPAAAILGPDATSESLAQLRIELGLEGSMVSQYFRFLSDLARGDFGVSIRYRVPALDLVLERVGATVELAAAALLVSITIGVAVGILAAVARNSVLDAIVRSGALLGQAVPSFFLGILAIMVFGVWLRWLPTGGRGGPLHLILPALSLGTYYAAITARFVRGAMIEVLGADFIRTARAKGLAPKSVLFRHALRNALLGVATLVGLQVGNLLAGAVVVETVFAWPGVGRLAVQAIYARDFPLVQVTIILSAVVYVVVNLITDLSYHFIDPRTRSMRAS